MFVYVSVIPTNVPISGVHSLVLLPKSTNVCMWARVCVCMHVSIVSGISVKATETICATHEWLSVVLFPFFFFLCLVGFLSFLLHNVLITKASLYMFLKRTESFLTNVSYLRQQLGIRIFISNISLFVVILIG